MQSKSSIFLVLEIKALSFVPRIQSLCESKKTLQFALTCIYQLEEPELERQLGQSAYL